MIAWVVMGFILRRAEGKDPDSALLSVRTRPGPTALFLSRLPETVGDLAGDHGAGLRHHVVTAGLGMSEEPRAGTVSGPVGVIAVSPVRELEGSLNKLIALYKLNNNNNPIDIALAAEGVDICEPMFDGDPSEGNYQSKIDYRKSFAFKDYILERNPNEYEFSDIDMTQKRRMPMEKDYFTLMDYSAKWDFVPSMLTQNHTQLVKGFMGQTTSFDANLIKSNVLIMGESQYNGEARYIHGQIGKGMFTYFGGHDPEDYQHRVGDAPTVLDLHPNSPGYRLILNNVLFPAAKKKKQKT